MHVDLRRMVDVTLASTALIVGAPLLLFVAAGVKLTTPTPLFFHQRRYGLNKKRFAVHKFGTASGERDSNGTLLPYEDRLSSFGKALRRIGFDELPQLWNIAKGEMSIIGPRPLPVDQPVEGWNERYQIRPGFIGLAGVREKMKGVQLSPEEYLKNDLEYIQKRCLALDLRIAFCAVRLAVTGRVDNRRLAPMPLPPAESSGLEGIAQNYTLGKPS